MPLTLPSGSRLVSAVSSVVSRQVSYVRIGPRFSNEILQILLVLINKRPPKGHRLLVIGTTSSRSVLEELELAGEQGAFTTDIHVPLLDQSEAEVRAGCSARVLASAFRPARVFVTACSTAVIIIIISFIFVVVGVLSLWLSVLVCGMIVWSGLRSAIAASAWPRGCGSVCVGLARSDEGVCARTAHHV
eukprot:1165463-Rhodomonas_salina.1